MQHDFFLSFLPLDALASSVYFKVMSIFCWQRLLLHKFRYKIYSINVRSKQFQYVHVNKIEIYIFRNQSGQVQKHIWNLIILVDHSIETKLTGFKGAHEFKWGASGLLYECIYAFIEQIKSDTCKLIKAHREKLEVLVHGFVLSLYHNVDPHISVSVFHP